ncbi:MAG TPA: hypothetical protein PLO37_13505, partial [Candidatus Hydrogenedentes bacterium]|nr:hypothetical protein [Candidatus Hydrogenedentota bacterium]
MNANARQVTLGTTALFILGAVTSIAWAHESLDLILDRTYPAEWLVCGPFPADVEGGIVEAAKRRQMPLGNHDFMGAAGGIVRARPEEGLAVEMGDALAAWHTLGTPGPCLDLSHALGSKQEGIVFAAFYAESAGYQQVYVTLNSTLGARVYLNGRVERGPRAGSFDSVGQDRFLLRFQQGVNLVLLGVPVTTFDGLAAISGLDVVELRSRGLANRPLLDGLSSAEIGIRLLAVDTFAGIAYAPKLEDAGVLSESGRVVRQDALLTLFNPRDEPSPPLTVKAVVNESGAPTRQVIAAIPPGAEREALLSFAVGPDAQAETLTVSLLLEHEYETARFQTRLGAPTAIPNGTLYVVTGQRSLVAPLEDQRSSVERALRQFARNLVVLEADPGYGFDLGNGAHWESSFLARPEARETVRRAVAMLRCGVDARFEGIDQRLACGETLARDLVYGVASAGQVLGDPAQCCYVWDKAGLCPQWPELLDGAAVEGVVSNVDRPGLPPLFWQLGFGASRVLHRHLPSPVSPESLIDLRNSAARQAKCFRDRLNTDLMVVDSAVEPPDPFYLGACTGLARSQPAIVVSGAGGQICVEETIARVEHDHLHLPSVAWTMQGLRLGELVAQPDLKGAYDAVEGAISTAEKLATFAALLGAEYPETAMDLAWRQLLHAGTPERLGFSPTPVHYVDTFSALREAAELIRDVRHNAGTWIAGQADTASRAPVGAAAGQLSAVVVFNPSSWTRTDVCVADVRFDYGAAGLSLVDDEGAPVPYWPEEVQRANTRIVGARIRFVARAVPSLGYRTYYTIPQGEPPRVRENEGAQIENEYYR